MDRFTRALVLVAAVLATTSAAEAALRAVEQAYELSLAEVTLPGNESGYLMVRRCPRCRPDVLRVDARTGYRLAGDARTVSLGELRTVARAVRPAASAAVYVYYDPRTRVVHRLVLDHAP